MDVKISLRLQSLQRVGLFFVTYKRLVSVSVSAGEANVSVSGFNVSCPSIYLSMSLSVFSVQYWFNYRIFKSLDLQTS